MFLKNLRISSQGRLIREINFHKGLNLIVDETPDSQADKTGNNVGKTTVLMLVDFCLGASAKHIYTDPENKKEEYKFVKDYLIENKVLIEIVLKEDLDRDDSREVQIERNFLPRSKKILRIDGIAKTEDAFEEGLTDILFPGHYGRKPTFRQIISHNIRYSDLSLHNTLKTLDGFTRDDEYETLYLFLLGCDFHQGDTKQLLRSQIRVEETFKTRLEKEQTKSAYETTLALLAVEISALEQRKSNFSINANFKQDLHRLNEIKYQVSLLSSELGRLELRRNLIAESQKDLEATLSNIDTQQLEAIYHQAEAQIGKLSKKFEELQQFHNRMISERVRYVTQDLPRLDEAITRAKVELGRLLQEEARLGKLIAQGDTFEELEELIDALNEKFRKKGECEKTLEQINEVEFALQKLTKQLDIIDDSLFSEDFERQIKDRVNRFNLHFSALSQDLYGEQYALKVDPKTNRKGQRIYSFSAFNVNFSSGKKQGEISCFDIAYTLYAEQEDLPCMHFLLTDKKELMHDNQLVKIAQIVNRVGVQFVTSILRDKLPPVLNSDEFIIVKLSQGDKLFRIENAALPIGGPG